MGMRLDSRQVLDQVLAWMREGGMTYLRFRQGEAAIELTLEDRPQAVAPLLAVTSPCSGEILLHHAVQAAPLVTLGDRVEAGDILALVAQGPLYSPIRAPRGGVIAGPMAVHGAMVEAGDTILSLA